MTLGYEAIVAQLLELGIPREKAEARAREACGLPDPAPTPEADPRVLEKKEQHEIIKRLRVCRFKVYSLSQARASKQTPGLPDLWCAHETLPIAFWWESKRQVGGELSTAQVEFRAECERAGIPYGTGDRYAVEERLIGLGVAERQGRDFVPTARARAAA